MERTEILLIIILMISLLSLWFSYKTYSKKMRKHYHPRCLLENYVGQTCKDNGSCSGYPNEICCPNGMTCMINDQNFNQNCGISPPPHRRP